MRFRSRFALALAGLAVVGAVGVADASSSTTGHKRLVITDPAGDTIAPGLPGDIVRLTFANQGTGPGSLFTSKLLVVTMELSQLVTAMGTTAYEVDADVAGCGLLRLYTTPGAAFNYIHGSLFCDGRFTDWPDPAGLRGESVLLISPEVVVRGKTITYRLDFRENTRVLKVGARIGHLHAFTHLVEPVQGEEGPHTVPYFVPATDNRVFYFDEAITTQFFTLG